MFTKITPTGQPALAQGNALRNKYKTISKFPTNQYDDE
jgi:hypothetical protein